MPLIKVISMDLVSLPSLHGGGRLWRFFPGITSIARSSKSAYTDVDLQVLCVNTT